MLFRLHALYLRYTARHADRLGGFALPKDRRKSTNAPRDGASNCTEQILGPVNSTPSGALRAVGFGPLFTSTISRFSMLDNRACSASVVAFSPIASSPVVVVCVVLNPIQEIGGIEVKVVGLDDIGAAVSDVQRPTIA